MMETEMILEMMQMDEVELGMTEMGTDIENSMEMMGNSLVGALTAGNGRRGMEGSGETELEEEL